MAQAKMDYKATLNLPKTAFAKKADLPTREPEILSLWETANLYQQIQRARQGAGKFVLHDGPPYANGDIHIGHALNKILKDIIVRYKTMRGFASPYVPGWDCHGMPIEHQLFKELTLTKHQIDQATFRAKARAYATRYVGIQREQFKRLGILGDWDQPYLTMSKDYELTILRVFKELVRGGYIYRGKKPVYWCASCETALAEAEVEYEDVPDTSIYVKLPLTDASAKLLLGSDQSREAFFVIWTTTPWTLPANAALALHPAEAYWPLNVDGEVWIVAYPRALSKEFLDRLNLKEAVLRTDVSTRITGREIVLQKVEYERPFASSPGRVVTDAYVSMEEGAGIVHIAPGHGQEDYVIGQREGLDMLSPVDHQGRFTSEVSQFAGQSVWEANPKIIEDLKRRGLLLHQELITHSYPHCWRCKQPVIFRATPQWFLRVDETFRKKLMDSATQVRWIPEVGLSRMQGMLEHRPDWCLSRQRYWGVPIPVLHCVKCDRPLDRVQDIEQVERALGERGIDAWFTASPNELIPGVTCPTCGGRDLRKETDILDVWFDSGVSHEAVLKTRRELTWPASLYLEGSDQHRGWFQVSLIPSVALHGTPPYERVLTHGFVMDGEGRKMSKSLGNVIAPQEVIERYGAEILRLWVASSDYREDVRISEAILEHVVEAYRKIRNTCRYLLANLYDFAPRRDTQPAASLLELDRWALHRTQRLLDEVTQAYEACQFHQAFRAIYQFCVLDLSAFYLDAVKDRLYTESAGSSQRRCAQTALYAILSSLVKALAPMLAITTEEVWQQMRALNLVEEPSVHLADWPAPLVQQVDQDLVSRWDTFLALRDVVMKALEERRIGGTIGSPLEAQVTLVVSDERLARLFETHRPTLAEAFVVSDLGVVKATTVASEPGAGTTVPGLAQVRVERAQGAKCQRCWKYTLTVGTQTDHPQLCERCVAVVRSGG